MDTNLRISITKSEDIDVAVYENDNKRIIILLVIALETAHAIFCCMTLLTTSTRQIQDVCPKSNAWLCILLVLTIKLEVITYGIFTQCFMMPTVKHYTKFIVAVSACSYVWALYELFGVPCVKDLRGGIIYDMLIVSFARGLIDCAIIIYKTI